MNTQSNKEQALAAFTAQTAEITTLLERLKRHAENHFDRMPQDVNWADVGSATECCHRLREIADFIAPQAQPSLSAATSTHVARNDKG